MYVLLKLYNTSITIRGNAFGENKMIFDGVTECR